MLKTWGDTPRHTDLGFVSGLAVFIFLLFAILNLSIGFAAAVLLGYGPQPWYAFFLPSDRDNVIQIDAIESEEKNETKQPQPEAEAEKPEAPKPPPEPAPDAVNQPFPEMNEPEDIPIAPEPVAPEEPVAEEVTEAPVNEDEDNELEEYLAGRKDEPKEIAEPEPAVEEASKIASADDIESMFATSQGSDEDQDDATAQGDADEDDELDDKPLDQNDIAALFNS